MRKSEREFWKLIQYCVDLGVEVIFKKKNTSDKAEYEDNIITLFNRHKYSHVYNICTILHELGHHFDFKENGMTKREENLLVKFNESTELRMPERLELYEIELSAIRRMVGISQDAQIEIPESVVRREAACDEYTYRYYHLVGRFPSQRQVNTFRKEVSRLEKYVDSRIKREFPEALK